MTPDATLRTQLRELLDEEIPAGGTAADTRFSDAQLDALLAAASTLEHAAALGWERKALRAMSERGGIEQSQAGAERITFVALREYRDHCLAMAELYRRKVAGLGSLALALEPPDVLGTSATNGALP